MGAVTYPDPEVQAALTEGFSLLSVDLMARHPDAKAASLGQRVMWAPTFLFTDSRHRELRRFTGWLPPESFRAELSFAQALGKFQATDFAGAQEDLGRLVEAFPKAEVVPEALYQMGMAGFLAGRQDWAALKSAWGRLVTEHPGSRWATHASVEEDAPE